MNSLIERIKGNFSSLRSKQEGDTAIKSLYQILYFNLKESILANDIGQGVLLPPTRVLADALDISRVTVNRAYELLCLEGYVDSRQGSGYVVKRRESKERSKRENPNFPPDHYPEFSEVGKSFLNNVSLINSTDDKSIAFRPGVPPLDIFPVNQWKNLMNLYWRHIKSSALTYSPSSGIDPLKQNIANYLSLSRGIRCDPRQVIIVSGSLQSLYLFGNVLLNPGDKVAMENPTFPNVFSIFSGLRAQVELADVDEEGLKVSQLNEARFAGSKLLHSTPACHYPKGMRMSMQRRTELLDWANRNKAYVIENDYEHEVCNHEHPMPSLFSMDANERTIYLSTFNRILHPSIRLGYMVVPTHLIDPIEAHLKHSHRFVAPSIQMVFSQFLEKKYLHQHIQRVIEVSAERELVFRSVFQEVFNSAVKLQPNISPSLHILALLPVGQKDRTIVSKFAEHNILVHAYSKCFFTPQKEQGLIMGYSSVRPQVIRTKVLKMSEAFNSIIHEI